MALGSNAGGLFALRGAPMAEFQEYPKWVTLSGHKPILCEDADEESALRAAHGAKTSAHVAGAPNALVAGYQAGDAATGHHGSPHAIADVLPKKSGWPKGKKRGPRNMAVN